VLGKYIHNLRTRPESHRKKIAFIFSALITLIVIAIWISVMQTGFFLEKNVSEREVATESSPIELIRRSIDTFSTTLGGVFLEIPKYFGGEE